MAWIGIFVIVVLFVVLVILAAAAGADIPFDWF